MTNLTDEWWQDVLEMADLELEIRVLKANSTVNKAQADDLQMDLYYLENPRRMKVFREGDKDEFAANVEHMYGKGCKVERAAYGWRRDYGEWPSFFNLTDRLATEAGISHGAARTRIQQAVNDPNPERYLHIIRAERLAEILNDEPHTCGPWSGPADNVRFYVAAEGQCRWASRYDALARLAAA